MIIVTSEYRQMPQRYKVGVAENFYHVSELDYTSLTLKYQRLGCGESVSEVDMASEGCSNLMVHKASVTFADAGNYEVWITGLIGGAERQLCASRMIRVE